MANWNVEPLIGVNGVKFGMKREDVRRVLDSEVKEFKKTKMSKTTTDDFGFCHVFYNVKDECEAIEIFKNTTVSVNGKVLFPGTVENAMAVLEDLEEDSGNYISKNQSIGIYASSGKIMSILFGDSGYYD